MKLEKESRKKGIGITNSGSSKFNLEIDTSIHETRIGL
jgi:hypothetical protein